MKYLYYLLLSVFFFSASACSEEDDDDNKGLKDGQYLYIDDDDVFCLDIVDSKLERLTVFIDGHVCYQNSSWCNTIDEFPNFTFEICDNIYQSDDPLVIKAIYKDNSFIATTTGYINSNLRGEKGSRIDIPSSMTFKYDKRVIDKNMDGILDWLQDL